MTFRSDPVSFRQARFFQRISAIRYEKADTALDAMFALETGSVEMIVEKIYAVDMQASAAVQAQAARRYMGVTDKDQFYA